MENTSVEINKTVKSDVLKVDPRIIIEEENFNTRIDLGNIDELKESIIANGVLVPLRGFKKGDNYVITDGHRRLTAIKKAISEGHDIMRVPFLSEKQPSDQERTFQILITNDGKPLSPIELAFTYQRLVNYGYTVSEIAKKIGKSYTHVNDTLLLATATKETVELIRENKVSSSTVRDMLKKSSADEVESKIKEVVTNVGKEKTVKSSDTRKHLVKNDKKDGTFTKEEVQKLLKSQIESIAEQFPEMYMQIRECSIIKF